jgi:hypothetical protein
MKKLLVIVAILATQMTSAFTKECPIVLASGLDYSWDFQVELPKDYTEKLKNRLEDEGYKVVEELNAGTYTTHPFIFKTAAKKNALSVVFRPALNYIPEDLYNGGQLFCQMSLKVFSSSEDPETLLDVEVRGMETKIPALAVLNCDAAFRKVVNQIPACE